MFSINPPFEYVAESSELFLANSSNLELNFLASVLSNWAIKSLAFFSAAFSLLSSTSIKICLTVNLSV